MSWKLHEHLNKEHYKCHVCEKAGLPNQFFKDYDRLEVHFRSEHFLCPDPSYLAARFVVFENEIDFRAHRMAVHGAGADTGRIQISFQVRGSRGQQPDNPDRPPTLEGGDFANGPDGGHVFMP